MYRKLLLIMVSIIVILNGVVASPVFAEEEQYRYERTKVTYSVQEVQTKGDVSSIFSGRYDSCKELIFSFVDSYYGCDGFKSYEADLVSGKIKGVEPYSLRTVDLSLTAPVLYKQKTDNILLKYSFGVDETDGNGQYYMRSAPMPEVIVPDPDISSDTTVITSGQAITLNFSPTPKSPIISGITDPVDPPKKGAQCLLTGKVSELRIIYTLASTKEVLTAGANTYPADGIVNGYYYKRLSTVRTVPLPEIKQVNVSMEANRMRISTITENKLTDLESKPYQFVINGVNKGWQTEAFIDLDVLQYPPNTNCNITAMLKGLNEKIVEKKLDYVTLADKPSVEINRLTDTGINMTIIDKNPAHTKYQIKIGDKYVMENGQTSQTEQWIVLSSKQLSVFEKITTLNNKISIKARNEAQIATAETVVNAIVVPSISLIKSAKAIEGTYAIKLKLSPSVSSKTLDKAPYQFVINGVATEWGKLPYYTFSNLQPNTEYKLIGRIKDSKGAISEIELTKRTLPTEQNLTFKYDDASMLMEIEQPNLSDLFNYDSFGNMIRKLFLTK